MHLNDDKSTGMLTVGGDVGISVMEELHTALLDVVPTNSQLVLDLSGVSSCDATLVQLLCSAAKTLRRQEKTLQVVEASPAVLEVSGVLGIPIPGYAPGGPAGRQTETGRQEHAV